MAIVDPSTQVYQALSAGLLAFAPFQSSLHAVQDISQPNFPQLIEQYGSGDCPAYLLLPTADEDNPWRGGSMEFRWTVSIALLVTTDSEQIVPIFSTNWMRRCAMPSLQMAMNALPFVMGMEWQYGRFGLGRFARDADAAASGSKRWTTVGGFKIFCCFGWKDLQALGQQYIAQG